MTTHLLQADPECGRLGQHDSRHRLSLPRRRERRQYNPGAAPLHDDRCERDIHRTGGKQPVHHRLVSLRIQIIQVRLDLNDPLGRASGP